MYSIDHVVLAVDDLDAAGEQMRRECGLASVPGGVHPGWGTGNRIVPRGAGYVKLISVVDPSTGRGTRLGRALLELVAGGRDRWFAVCLSTDDLDAVASRLGLEVEQGARTRPDGRALRWRGAGIDDEAREPWLPFFIEWDMPPALHPGRIRVANDVDATGIRRVEVGGNEARLRDWLGPPDGQVPISIVDGDPAVRAVVLDVEGRALRIEAP